MGMNYYNELVGCDRCEPKRGKLARRPGHEILGLCPTCAEAELTRLRAIEAALLDGEPAERAAQDLRDVATYCAASIYPPWLWSIADALAKPK